MELDMLPPRIQRLRIKIMPYQFKVLHVPGKLLATADTLSRINNPNESLVVNVQLPTTKTVAYTPLDVMELYVAETVAATFAVLPLNMQEVRRAQSSDSECTTLISFCQRGWPQEKQAAVAHQVFVGD